MPIEAAEIELTNKSDLDSIIQPKSQKEYHINFNLIRRILKENVKLETPIRYFDFWGGGNPLLYEKIEKLLELFNLFNVPININTNGLNLREIVGKFSDQVLVNTHFSVYLDSADEKKNNYIMGNDEAFKKTIESIEYLRIRGLPCDMMMRVNALNYMEIEQVLEISKFYGCGQFIPIEVYPFLQNKELLLTDKMKLQVIETINKLRNVGEPVHKTIHFEKPEANCSYLRNSRIFINSKGIPSFCHFLWPLENTKITNKKNVSLKKLIEIDGKIRNSFVKEKENKMKKSEWIPPRVTASPCSYCLNCFEVSEKW